MNKHKEAISLIEGHGGLTKLAKKVNLTPSAVGNWRSRGIPWRIKAQFPELFKRPKASNE